MQRKDAPDPGRYSKPMTQARSHVLFRLCLALLPVLGLLSGTWAQASMPPAGPMTVVICSDGAMKTVRLDAQGEPGQAPQDCRDCPACVLPMSVGFAPITFPARPVAGPSAVDLPPGARLVPTLRTSAPLSRGPPIPFQWRLA